MYQQHLVMSQRMAMRPSAMLVQAAQQLELTREQVAAQVAQQLAINPALEPAASSVAPQLAIAPSPSRRNSESFDWQPPDDGTSRLPGTPAPSDELEIALRASLPVADHAIVAALVGAIDHRGYLTAGDDEIADWAGATESRVRAVRRLLRQLAPTGVGSRDARDCLIGQLGELQDVPAAPRRVARDLIANHLDDLAAGRLAVIQAALEISREEIIEARELIRARLRPYPQWERSQPPKDAGPDALIVRDSGARQGLRVELLEAQRLRVRVDARYASLAHGRATGEVAASVASAQAFISTLRCRWMTLQRVIDAVVQRQAAFVLGGPADLVPLTQAQIALELALAESTVSRALHGRRVQLPDGRTVPFVVFFDAALGLRAALAALVEDEGEPLADGALAQALSERGFAVSRRVVAKHRERLGIPTAALR